MTAALGRSHVPTAGVSVGLRALLLVTALVATGGAVFVISVSRIAPDPVAQAALTAVVSLSFAATGVIALRLRPYARFGWLLGAVGFTSLISTLHEANHPFAYTVGLIASNAVFAVLLHAFVGFPGGRLGSVGTRLLVLGTYVDVLVLQAIAVLFDPLTRYHSAHPRNLALVDANSSLATGLQELEAAIAAGLGLAAVLVLSRRARAATPAARRQLVPVLVGGTIALIDFVLGLALAPLSSRAGLVGFGLGLVAALALPAAFLAVVLQGRLSRAAVGELLLELREPGQGSDLEDALRRALGDPSLRLGRVGAHEGSYVDSFGVPLELPRPGGAQVTKQILYQGEAVGLLVHDRFLRLRQDLLDAVSAAAGFALANEQALHTTQLIEQRNRALLDAIPDTMLRVARDGTYLDIRPDENTALLGPAEEMIGRNVRELVPADLAETVMSAIERTLESGSVNTVEYELPIRGVGHWKEARMVPSGDDEVVAISRDFTEQRRAEAGRRRLGEEQAALRRVATLVAGDAPPEVVFQTVTEEASNLIGIRTAVLHRFEDGQTSTIVGKFGGPTGVFYPGSVIKLETGAALAVLQTGAPARSNYEELEGPGALELRSLGFRGSVGVPIIVAGATWGALVIALREGESLPVETERRLEAFAELVGLAVASAHARDELSASRRRIIEASDAERRRIERNLHDGAQQRLVALSVSLRLAQAKVAAAPDEAAELLAEASQELTEALTELRELAQGIHPAVLTERGLAAALEVLAARAPLPVSLDVHLPDRLPEAVEAAAYYVASESLANVVKHAHANSAAIRAEGTGGIALIEVADDGAGGAEPDGGSGLRGLRDRVETLAGRLHVDSARGEGTRVRAELPVPEWGSNGRAGEER